MKHRQSLTIIGCGRLGKTLARLWHDNGLLHIHQVLNTSLASSTAATKFIGAGEAVEQIADLTPADFWLIASDDQSITNIAGQLADTAPLKPGNIVFHCSGAQSSNVLKAVRRRGASIGSVHPVQSFAQPQSSIHTFAGSCCAIEGETTTTAALGDLFTGIGGKLITVDSDNKLLYHAASTIASNYLVSLLDASMECFELAGIPRQQATQLLRPILHTTVDAVLETNPASALTGPIARGDTDTVEKQLASLRAQAPKLAEIYRVLGQRTTELSKQKGQASPEKIERLLQLLT